MTISPRTSSIILFCPLLFSITEGVDGQPTLSQGHSENSCELDGTKKACKTQKKLDMEFDIVLTNTEALYDNLTQKQLDQVVARFGNGSYSIT